MKKFEFRYHMKISFDSMIHNHRFTLKCLPQDDERQHIERLDYDIYPNRFISEGRDSFGNKKIYGFCEHEHDKFYIDVTGIARVGMTKECIAGEINRIGFYKYQTEHTTPGEQILAFHEAIGISDKVESNLERATAYMHQLYERFIYETGSTSIGTTAEQAFAQGKGVCQDYAHILLSLCRLDTIPCRYVCGMMVGEGLSHAWVEVYHNGMWIALDPTNNLLVEDEHIKISHGRDYKDCSINQGVFIGNTSQLQEASVSVVEQNQ